MISIHIDEDYYASPKIVTIGNRGEVASRSIVFDAPTVQGATTYTARFLTQSGVTYETLIIGDVAAVPAIVMAATGTGYLQWVARNDTGQLIAKSDVIKYNIMTSVGDEAETAPAPEDTASAIAQIEKVKQDAIAQINQIINNITVVDGNIQEVIDAREGHIVANTFSSLQRRLAADFDACITQGELESALASAVTTLAEKDVGQFWKNEQGEIKGEIFNCYLGGIKNTASGNKSHAEGVETTASGNVSHAEGSLTTASGSSSHAEGDNSTASGISSHAEGHDTTASASTSHAEGNATIASGEASHAEGFKTTASGDYAHAGGFATRANGACQFAIGKWNKYKGDDYAFIIGNGSQSAYSDALEMDWNGNLWTAGDITATDAAGSTVSLCGTQEQLIQQQSAIGMNRKNLLKNTAGTVTQNGITFTLNADGSVTCSGTATADTNYRYIADLQQNTSYILSGCPEGGSTSTYQLFAMDADTWSSIQRDTGSGKTFDSGTHTTWHIIIRIASGQTVEGMTFYPMLRYGFITDDAYQPYTDDLQTQIDALRAAIISLGGNV